MSEDGPRSLEEIDFVPRGKAFSSPRDWRDQFIYHLLVDRFNDGRRRPPYRPGLEEDREEWEGEDWQGGNLLGVAAKLDYIRDLGCSAIWLSPIFKNRKECNTYHGYAIQNYLSVDPRFGTNEDLQRLVEAAHKKGIYVILDIVLNHTGDNWAYEGGGPRFYSGGERYPFGFWRKAGEGGDEISWPDDAVWPVEFQEMEWYRRMGEISHWDEYPEARDGDFSSLKELYTSKGPVLSALIDVYKHWIAKADVDGYRLDAVKHMEDSSTAIFCNAIREYAQSIGKMNFFLYGEVVGDDSFIDSYIGRNIRQESGERFPSLDAALDFPLWRVLEGVIKGFLDPQMLRDRYRSLQELYADHGQAGQYFVTFADNHDQIGRSPIARFLHKDPYREQAALVVGYLLTSLGVPCIYYGTEQGFDGGGNHDKYIRECLFGGRWGAFGTSGHHFFDPNHEVYRRIAKVASIREREFALRYGRQYFREVSGGDDPFHHPDKGSSLAYSRILDATEILIAMNLSQKEASYLATVDRNLTPPGCVMEDLLHPESRYPVREAHLRAAVEVSLPPLEMIILKRLPKGKG